MCISGIKRVLKIKKNFTRKLKKSNEYDAHGNIQLSGSGILGDFLANEIKIFT